MPTIGVAIAVPEPHGGRLQRLRASFGDTRADAIPTHVTLLPPTEVDDQAYAALEGHLEAVAAGCQQFPMLLRGTGTFRPVSPVVFVQVARGIADCEQLERAIRSGPVMRQLEFGYHPHVTVAQGLDEAALDVAFEKLADYSAAFLVTSIELYRHGDDDDVWRTERSFSLAAPPPAADPDSPQPLDTEASTR